MKVIAEKMDWEEAPDSRSILSYWGGPENGQEEMAYDDHLTPAGAVAVWNSSRRIRYRTNDVDGDFCTAVKNAAEELWS